MAKKLAAIILSRKPTHDESLLLETLLENGKFQTFKIPGVLKSTKRNAFHFTAGAVYRVIFNPREGMPVIPQSSELIFSPFAASQDYLLLMAVSEVVKATESIHSTHENAPLFLLIEDTLRALVDSPNFDTVLDRFHWRLLEFLGLQAEPEDGVTYAAYDLADGFLTANEVSERVVRDTLLPLTWIHAAIEMENIVIPPTESSSARQKIRRYLKSL